MMYFCHDRTLQAIYRAGELDSAWDQANPCDDHASTVHFAHPRIPRGSALQHPRTARQHLRSCIAIRE
jgi:hypothetical protein